MSYAKSNIQASVDRIRLDKAHLIPVGYRTELFNIARRKFIPDEQWVKFGCPYDPAYERFDGYLIINGTEFVVGNKQIIRHFPLRMPKTIARQRSIDDCVFYDESASIRSVLNIITLAQDGIFPYKSITYVGLSDEEGKLVDKVTSEYARSVDDYVFDPLA
jgi:hypothetical protein